MHQADKLQSEIRDLLQSELGGDLPVEFVEDDGRLDVRVGDPGIVETLEKREEELSATCYSELRFTVQTE